MTLWICRLARADEADRVLAIWAAAVDATHHFLAPADRDAIGEEVAAFLPGAPLWVAVAGDGPPMGFMLLDGAHIEALFVHPDARGMGAGRALVLHALSLHDSVTTDVNEQNAQAVGFYERMGFARTGRSALDGQGRPYPLLHLRWPASTR